LPGEGATTVVPTEVHPGRVHWIVEWTVSGTTDGRDCRRTAEGTLDLAPGETATIDVPAPSEDQPRAPK
jgi:hypothetical protein